MKIAKCDICGKTAAEFYQVKFRIVTGKKTGAAKQYDLCDRCFEKARTAVTSQKKDVKTVS